jgi:hypothetical protein
VPDYAEFASSSGKVIGLRFDDFLEWLKRNWEPGQHMAVIAPTGEGKTTFVKPVLDLRKWVMVLDAKGMDDTLEQYGYVRISAFPLPRKMRNDIADGKPAHIVIGTAARTDEEDAALKALMLRALKEARQNGGWTVYGDEFQILADRRMYGLDKAMERMLIAARKDKSSVVTSFQAAAWVPKAALRQCRIAVVGPTRDRQMIKNVAEAMGRTWYELTTIIDQFEKFDWAVIPRNVRHPIILTHPPKL